MFVAIGMGGVLAGCGGPSASTGTGQDQSATDQFLAERQGTVTPGANNGGTVTLPGVFGTITKIDGDRITISNPIDNSTSVVELADGGKIMKQVDGQASDIKVGDSIAAFGSKNGDDLAAEAVSIGGEGMVAGAGAGPVRIERPAGGDAGGSAPPAGGDFQVVEGQGQQGGGAQGNVPEVVGGTVEKIDGSTLTVKTADGTATVTLSDSTKVQKQVEVKLSDLGLGETIMATGTREGDTLKATTINVQSAMVGIGPGQTP
jgi:hypothetical protein